jgi:serine/threonine protein kinase
LYQLLTGEVPFSGGTIVEKVARHAVDPPPPLTSRCRDIPTELAGIVEKMLAKDPNDRYQTPSEVAEVLAPFIESPAEKRPALAFSRWFVWVVVGVVLGVALFVGWIVQRPR